MMRPADTADVPAMAKVLSGWIDDTLWMPRIHTLAKDFAFCQSLLKTTEVWVADASDGLGFVARHGDRIDALYLALGLRRKSCGTALLNPVQQDRTTLLLWTFQAKDAALRFYEANYFHISDVTLGEGNIEKLPNLHMTWTKDI
jgi:GNAT superfamily N-acetyltransferase